MDLEKLGKRIRMAREARGITQNSLIIKIESLRRLDDPKEDDEREKLDYTTVSKWEHGRQKISPHYIRLVVKALSLNYDEEIYWLGLAGHIVPAPLPTARQIESILETYCIEINRHPFPAIIVDSHYNLWAINPAATLLVGSYETAVELMQSRFLNLFSLFFDSQYLQHIQLGSPAIDFLQRQQIVLFLITNLYNRYEPFWQSYPECWQSQLSEPDYDRFALMWNDACKEYIDTFESAERFVKEVIKYSYVSFSTSMRKPIRFKVMAEFPSHFSNNFFHVLYYVLDNDKDKPEAEELFKDFQGKDTRKLKQWEIRDIDEILAAYR